MLHQLLVHLGMSGHIAKERLPLVAVEVQSSRRSPEGS